MYYQHFLFAKLGMLSVLLLIAGVILLVLWANKNLSKNQLKHASLWLIGIGIALGILASAGSHMMGGRGMKMMKGDNYNAAMMDAMRDRGMEMDEVEFEGMMEDVAEMLRVGGMKSR